MTARRLTDRELRLLEYVRENAGAVFPTNDGDRHLCNRLQDRGLLEWRRDKRGRPGWYLTDKMPETTGRLFQKE
jgi:hypothetical protein